MTVAPQVSLKHGSNSGIPFVDCFIVHEGKRFYSRGVIDYPDTPQSRAMIGQEFLRRLKRFPSVFVGGSQAHKPVHGGYPSDINHLVAFHPEGAPPANRPALSIVRN